MKAISVYTVEIRQSLSPTTTRTQTKTKNTPTAQVVAMTGANNMTDELEKKIQYSAKLELLLMLQDEANRQFNIDVMKFVRKFVEENK